MSNPLEKPEEEEVLEAQINNITLTNQGFIIFLKCDDGGRLMPIFIGPNEAQSITLALSQEPAPRPMTHDLLKNMLEYLDGAVTRVEITDIQDNTFFGRIWVSKSGFEDFDFDARPSDAIALALRWRVPIFVRRHVFEKASISQTGGDDEQAEKEDSPAAEGPAQTPLEKLKLALEKAVREERYEEAARLRDELRTMQSGN